jgi:hypothetical protein
MSRSHVRSMSKFSGKLAWALLLTALAAAPAAATCGSANCFLVTGVGDAVVEPGETVVDLSYRYIPQDVKLSGTHHTGTVRVPAIDFATGTIVPGHHAEVLTINMLAELDVTYGLTPNLTLAVALPFMNDRIHEHYDDVDLSATPPDPGTFINTAGTSGFGDVALSLRYAALTTKRHRVTVGGGVKLPTGEYKLRDQEGAVSEPTLMPGTGSVDYLLSAMYQYLWVPGSLTGFASLAPRFNTANPMHYRMGDSVVANAGLAWNATDRVTFSGQLNARRAWSDEFLGMWVPDTGNTFVFATPGVRLATGKASSLYAFVQLPVYEKVTGNNLAPRYGLQLGVNHSF